MEAQGYDDKENNFKPSIRVHLPKASQQPAEAVIICPGSGYGYLAMTHRGYNWTPFFNEQGMAAIVLRYHMPNGNREVPIPDACETIRYAREHASEWNINPDCVDTIRFSADGHLAPTVATHASEEFHPAFQILFYPVISVEPRYGRDGSYGQFLGEKAAEESKKESSNKYQVDSLTPRAFIALPGDDRGVVPINSIRYHSVLKEEGISAAMCIYPSGGHEWRMKDSFKLHNEMLIELKAWLMTF